MPVVLLFGHSLFHAFAVIVVVMIVCISTETCIVCRTAKVSFSFRHSGTFTTSTPGSSEGEGLILGI